MERGITPSLSLCHAFRPNINEGVDDPSAKRTCRCRRVCYGLQSDIIGGSQNIACHTTRVIMFSLYRSPPTHSFKAIWSRFFGEKGKPSSDPTNSRHLNAPLLHNSGRTDLVWPTSATASSAAYTMVVTKIVEALILQQSKGHIPSVGDRDLQTTVPKPQQRISMYHTYAPRTSANAYQHNGLSKSLAPFRGPEIRAPNPRVREPGPGTYQRKTCHWRGRRSPGPRCCRACHKGGTSDNNRRL